MAPYAARHCEYENSGTTSKQNPERRRGRYSLHKQQTPQFDTGPARWATDHRRQPESESLAQPQKKVAPARSELRTGGLTLGAVLTISYLIQSMNFFFPPLHTIRAALKQDQPESSWQWLGYASFIPSLVACLKFPVGNPTILHPRIGTGDFC